MIHWVKQKIPKCFKLQIKRGFQNIWQSIVYKIIRPKRVEKYNIKHIVFVCKGNICRSAFAEYILKKIVNNKNYIIESCGIEAGNGCSSPDVAIDVGRLFKIDLSANRSKNISKIDFINADIIFSMDYNNYVFIIQNYPELKSKTVLLREFCKFPRNIFVNIDDPYGLGFEEFFRCSFLINECVKRFFERYIEGQDSASKFFENDK